MGQKLKLRPDFSIITVTRNDEEGLKKTLACIAPLFDDQAAIEHVIVDGGSSYDVESLVSRSCPKSVFISEPDDGIYDAMNKGMTLISGRYFIFINSGDVFLWKELFTNVSFRRSEYDFVYGDSYELENNKKKFKPANHHLTTRGGMFTHHQAMIFRHEFVEKCGIKHDNQLKIAGDWDFVIKIMKHKPRILYLPIPICIFDEGGISKTQIPNSRREVFSVRLKHFGLGSAVTRRAVQDAARLLRSLSPPTYTWMRRAYVRAIHRLNG